MAEFTFFLVGLGIGAVWGAGAAARKIHRRTAICLSYPVAWLVFVVAGAMLEPLWNVPRRPFATQLFWVGIFAISFSLTAPLGCWVVMRRATSPK
jgi:CDP-diglyceride synthetase